MLEVTFGGIYLALIKFENIKECKSYTCWLRYVHVQHRIRHPPEVKWVELPSSCVVLGSWSIYFFGCCRVNSCCGLIWPHTHPYVPLTRPYVPLTCPLRTPYAPLTHPYAPLTYPLRALTKIVDPTLQENSKK